MPIRSIYRSLLLVGGASLALLVGCTEGDETIVQNEFPVSGREYFPLETGRFWEYDVEEHHWNYNRDSVVRCQFRERIDTVFLGATGEPTYRIVRSRRDDSLGVWREDSTLALVNTADLLRSTSNNVPAIELLFPVREGKSWNPNLFNSATTYAGLRTYAGMDASLTLPYGRSFARTLRVIDEPQNSEVNRREQESAYAWGIGRIYRRRQILDYCNSQQVAEGRCQIGSGYIVRGATREEQLRKWGVR